MSDDWSADLRSAGAGAAAAIDEVYRLFCEGISDAVMNRSPIYDNETGGSMAILDRMAMEERVLDKVETKE